MEKTSVTLTDMPSPITAVMAGRPASVAGILISWLGRSTIFHSSIACRIVLSVSWASRGSTSMETRPSTPPDASHFGASTSRHRRCEPHPDQHGQGDEEDRRQERDPPDPTQHCL